jgi:hypothetical protein
MSPAQPSQPRRRKQRAVTGNNLATGDGQGRAPLLTYYLDPNYTTNLCPNPSFEASIAGWSGTDGGTQLAQTAVLTNAQGQQLSGIQPTFYGGFALQVTTDGTAYNQGAVGPAALTPAFTGPVLGSMTASFFGQTGTLNVSAIGSPGGVVMATATLVLNGSGWQTIVLNGLLFPPSASGGSVFLSVTTANNQAIVFYVDGVMYEPESPAHPYIDGDMPGAQWQGTAELSASFQQYQWSIQGLLSFQLSGTAAFVAGGQQFQLPSATTMNFTVSPIAGTMIGLVSPATALTDFGIWELTDPDPAQTYAWWTNSGTSSGQTSYSRIYAMVVPPLDYPVSGGNFAWRRAAYMAVGFQWLSVPNGQYQLLTDVQLEYAQTNVGSATVPSAYQRPRQLQTIVKANRMNYITNPAMQVSTANWSGIQGNETLLADNSQYPGSIVTYNNLGYSIMQSLKCTLTASSSQGVQITIPFLLPGEAYTISFWCLPGPQMTDIIGSCGGASGDIASLIVPGAGYGVQPYGSGPYGGIYASSTAIPQTWAQAAFSFTAPADSLTLTVTGVLVLGANYPTPFWVTAVLCEPGDVVNPYFDGNSGPDALWETGGTAGLARSYYYNQLQYGQSIVTATMASNTPLGISYGTPLYATPPMQ